MCRWSWSWAVCTSVNLLFFALHIPPTTPTNDTNPQGYLEHQSMDLNVKLFVVLFLMNECEKDRIRTFLAAPLKSSTKRTATCQSRTSKLVKKSCHNMSDITIWNGNSNMDFFTRETSSMVPAPQPPNRSRTMWRKKEILTISFHVF